MDVNKSNSVMFGLHFTWNDGYALNLSRNGL